MKKLNRPIDPQAALNPPRTFNERFEEIARRFPDRTAFRMKTGQGYPTVSYGEAYRRARAVASGLLALGLKSGDRVAILSENRPEWVAAYLGIYLSGMIAVPLDTQISPSEWRRLLDDAQAQTVFVSGSLLPNLKEAAGDARPSRRLISFDPVSGDRDARLELAGLMDWASRLPDPPALPKAGPSDIVTIIYTSGTTGTPKGVMLTQSNIVGEIRCILQAIHADENDALLCLLPLQHVLASVINVLVPLYLGAQVVFADTLRRSEIMQALEEAGITILATVPQFFYLFHNRIQQELGKRAAPARALFRGLLRLNRCSMRLLRLDLGRVLFPGVRRNFGSRLRLFVSGGSAFDPKVAQDFHDMGFIILQGYGLTETTGACTVTRVENNVIGSVGPALPGAEVKILSPDENGIGEVLIRGPMVMKGYYNNPAATAEAIRDGWFYSGDLGRLDAKGNLFITGRKKEVIVLPNGKNIYPDEVEAHYLQSPCIQEIAVLGIYSPQERGERLHGVVVPDFEYLKSRKVANAREILRDEIAALSRRLPQYKRLMSYQVQSEPLPRTTSRKIKRLELKRLIESGGLKPSENAPPADSTGADDRALMESAAGQEVLACLRETYRRDAPIQPDMNLELDLGFDSMERVELLAGLEQALNLQLPEDFGADILTVRDLIVRLEQQAGGVSQGGGASRRSWRAILSEESLGREEDVEFRISGPALTLLKFALLRLIDLFLFRPLCRLEARGLENLPSRGAYLLCPNHESYLDPFVLAARLPYRVFRRVFFVGYSVFFDHWLMRIFARPANIIPVDPDAHLLRAMKAGAMGLRAGCILCIFPEGGRSFDGRLQAFKKGASILSRELSVPIVPVGIEGAHEVWPRDSLRIRPHKVTVRFGEPLFPSPDGGADPYREDTDRLREAVERLIRD
jgi:long-chain acyl-CoA synthetase